jgi:CheY-like chemotaxis protein
MLSCLVDSNSLEEEKDLVGHHQYIGCKEYDRTIMKKLNSLRNLDPITYSIKQQDQLNRNNKDSLKSKKIMLVEDEDDIVMLFKMILESDVGVNVDSFTEPFSALNNFRSGLYDLIMIDIALPRMNGIELYYKIRKIDDKVKICFLTAGEMYYEEVRKQVFPELEANCFIRKPITNEDLIRRVKNLLGIQ